MALCSGQEVYRSGSLEAGSVLERGRREERAHSRPLHTRPCANQVPGMQMEKSALKELVITFGPQLLASQASL